ncbi:N-acetylglucosamine-6-phosphate deacetylase [Cohnella thailandensis]|uniref:N-acetylglucosamine-6-phosphate deacetylase n=1 Tax=Cohnella thailandensis TaxID=557557 RepID=A0A841T8M7_9BACL|nr:N-acetylglucosamine-6-phosphate deacetylase [Cohnella thailandensis]MBB6637531.1 N-acetylglucosamine-6-phosphate deacetylase [Cohnella thailandensis]
MASLQISNVRVALRNEILEHAAVVVEGSKIVEVMQEDKAAGSISHLGQIDGRGNLLIPGMIDVHIHGARGYDMMDGTIRSIEEVSIACAETGCTSFLATSVSSTIEQLIEMIHNVARVSGREAGARIAGIHIEGPYLNPKRKGMQNERYLRHPDLDELQTILSHAGDRLKMITLAPELPGAMESIDYLTKLGIIVAIAHSDATYEEAKLAFEHGASHITHCFNGMRPIHHRDPGLIAAAFEEEKVSLQAIVDGVHLHPAIVRLLHRIKGPDGVVLITDALQAMGLGDGRYQFGGHDTQVVNGVARLQDGTLASSTVTMNEALRNTVQLGIPLPEAVAMASRTPAQILGLPGKGRIERGADADLVLLDEQFNVVWTMVEGQVVYKAKEE